MILIITLTKMAYQIIQNSNKAVVSNGYNISAYRTSFTDEKECVQNGVRYPSRGIYSGGTASYVRYAISNLRNSSCL